ncbi:hypothetical protein M9H77_28566 [Catharanthus roseus]|uniref:Uncharacterized protein n=1 Tax=Catharanthus roseus TaxID=4058 RepID=A0ACC0AFQ1_CATRO|nr:hypothetical protein M9H77_28566 [Catharanthus roseus]
MLRLHDLRRSSCNRLSSSEKVMCRLVISYDFSENKTLKIYNVVAKIKKNQIQGRNTVGEVLCLSAQRGYMVFYRNCEESNMLSDIVVVYPTSIAMIRTYNMPLLKAIGMTPTGKNFTLATAFMCNEQATTYRWILQQIKHSYITSAMSNGHGSILNEGYLDTCKLEEESGNFSSPPLGHHIAAV